MTGVHRADARRGRLAGGLSRRLAGSPGGRLAGRRPTSRRRLGADNVVVALGGAFVTVVVGLTSVITQGVAGSGFGANPMTIVILALLTVAFVAIAAVVSTSSVTNAFILMAAMQVREVALRRLLGSTATAEYGRLVGSATRRAVWSALAGALVGLGVGIGIVALSSGRGGLLEGMSPSAVLQPLAVVPLVVLVLGARSAARVGFRGVLSVAPAQAFSAAEHQRDGDTEHDAARFSGRHLLLFTGASVFLALGLAVGFVTPFAVLFAMVGGVLAALGIVRAATPIITTVIRGVSRRLGRRSPSVRVAGSNLLQYPARTGRAAVGVLMSVTVLTMFAVASATLRGALVAEYAGTSQSSAAAEVLSGIIPLLSALTISIAVISAVGIAQNVALDAHLRQRDLAVLRVLGLTVTRAGRMLLVEAALLVGSATVAGLGLGAVLGWSGVQTLLASTLNSRVTVPLAPIWFVPVVLIAVAALTFAVSRAPVVHARRSSSSAFLTRSLQETP
ncbi:ABC transporter permease [Curtobacterium sp. ISL-83]|uniref:ABC transporter permease n=1 Tax=Curtobacterium sp. ISL-83 TaxID=2819145 RepID=UPI001BE89BC3|nr:ABC transporter permease [Curtobacterium sp. ISL-83]MBT2502411.1 ABC transporter permease [Curtobacterium sp. ISL-83]